MRVLFRSARPMLGQHSAYSFVELPVGNKVAVYLWPEISVSFPHLLRGRPGGSRTLAVSETFRDIWFSDEGQEVDLTRSEARRVGKECGSKCRSRGSQFI